MDGWKSNRTIQIVVGVLSLAVVMVAVKWLFFSANLENAVAVMVETPPDDAPRGVGFSLTWPAVLDAVLSVLASVGAFVLTRVLPQLAAGFGGLWSSIAAGSSDDGHVADASSASGIVLELAQAVAKGSGEVSRLMWQIRKPYALHELVEAYSLGDSESVERLNAELKAGVANEQ